MTVVPTHDYSDTMDIKIRYRFGNGCSRCGAATKAQANLDCRPYQDETGEYSCPADGDGHLSDTFDARGRYVTPTNKSLRDDAKYWHDLAVSEGLTK